jgi:PAS domain S-box-containing protein
MFDMKTVSVGFFVSDALAAGILWSVRTRYRSRFAGVSLWLAFYLLQTAGMLLVALRGLVPDWLSIVTAQLFTVGGAFIFLTGLGRFLGRPAPRWPNVILISVFTALMIRFTAAAPDIRIRTLLLFSVLLIVALQGAWMMLKRRPEALREAARPVGFLFLAYAAAHVYRIVLTLVLPLPDVFFRTPWPHTAGVMADQMLGIAMAFALVLMVDKRVLDEIRAAEKFMKESEERYRIVSENTYDWEYWQSPDGDVRYMSPSCERVSGYSVSDFIADPGLLNSIVRPDDREILERHEAEIRSGAADSNPPEIEFRILRKDGGARWIAHICHAIRRPDGSDLGRRATNRDVTDRKQAETEIRVLARFPSENPNPVLRIDRSGILLYRNEAAERNLTGLNLRVGAVAEEPLRRMALGALSVNRAVSADVPVSNLVFSFTSSPQSDAGYVNVYAKDITGRIRAEEEKQRLHEQADRSRQALLNILEDQKQADETVRALNERLSLLIRAVQELASARDLDAVAASVKTYARTLAGSDGSTFVLREGDFCHYVDEDAVGPLWKGRKFPLSACVSGWVITNGKPAVIEDVYSDPRVLADAYRPTFVKSLAIVPIRTSDSLGAIGSYWSAYHQATEMELSLAQTLADAAARAVENIRLVEGLERGVSERTSELESVNRELESFSYSVSHDLRSPLRGIDGWSHALLEDFGQTLDAKAREYLDRVRSETQRMGRLIDDLLQLSRITRDAIRVETVDLSSAVESVLRRLREENPARDVRCGVEPGLEAEGDATLLEILLTNLIGNAWKFTGKTPGAAVSFGRTVAGEFFVRDNGAGFDMRYAQKLFAPFQRMHKQSEFPGTGVGLATVYRIVTRLGGRIRCESAPGLGTTFFFTLGGSHEGKDWNHGVQEDHSSGGG